MTENELIPGEYYCEKVKAYVKVSDRTIDCEDLQKRCLEANCLVAKKADKMTSLREFYGMG
jgi:hypothetical protein